MFFMAHCVYMHNAGLFSVHA